MTQAVVTRRDGDAFQARMFWRKAACLLDPESPVKKVGFEIGPKGFDDIWVEYYPPLKDQEGDPLTREYIQCKWHVTPNSYGYEDLVDPAFINANARSFLKRALDAQRIHAPEGKGIRFKLLTNWRIDLNDPLRNLVHQRSHTLRIDRLFEGGGERSAVGRVRKAWRDHLGIDDDSLRDLAYTMAFSEATDSLSDLRDALDPYLRIAGLRRIPENESSFPYDDIVFQWVAQGHLEHDEESFRSACEKEGFFVGPREEKPKVFGVKSFEHPTDRLEDRCTDVLDLIPQFDDRFIRSDEDWGATLYPKLKTFLRDAAQKSEALRLILDAHLTLSFAAGTILDIKSGREIELEQRTLGKNVWSANDIRPDTSWSKWTFDIQDISGEGAGIAVAVSLTHDIAKQVRSYIGRVGIEVGSLVTAQPESGSGARSVRCGRHAFDLAEALTEKIRTHRDDSTPRSRVHLFIAAPGAFSFFLGQRYVAIGPSTLYEYDFEGVKSGSYEPSLVFPVVGN